MKVVLLALLIAQSLAAEGEECSLLQRQGEECSLLQHRVSDAQRREQVQELDREGPPVVFRIAYGKCSTGRMGNLLFMWASLLGLTKTAGPRATACYDKNVHRWTDGKNFRRDFRIDRLAENCPRIATIPEWCAVHWEEQSHTGYSPEEVGKLLAQVQSLRACESIEVKVRGCFQNWRYFDAIQNDVRLNLAPPEEHRSNASSWLASQRAALSKEQPEVGWRFVGVQVRLGDKVHNEGFNKTYAPTDWGYFGAAMREVEGKLAGLHPKDRIAFVITVGGSVKNSTEDANDLREAKQAFSRELKDRRLIFVEGNPALTDLALLSSMDGLVISGSTFGWWAAYLSKAGQTQGLVAAPRHIYKPLAARHRDYHAEDYYPPTWTLVDNLEV